jgi:hypothetical protein
MGSQESVLSKAKKLHEIQLFKHMISSLPVGRKQKQKKVWSEG